MVGVLRVKVDGQWVEVPGASSGWVESPGAQEVWPAGSIRPSISSVADPGWLLFGATYADAQTLYPALWLVAPAGWKVGSSLVVPSDVDCGLRGSSAAGLGQISGANVKTLALTHMPAHGHPVNFWSGNDSTNHSHGVNIWSGYVNSDHAHHSNFNTSGESEPHYHGSAGGAGDVLMANDNGRAIWILADGGNRVVFAGTTHWNAQGHLHAATGWSGGISANHQHHTSGQSDGVNVWHQHGVNGTTDNVGSGTPLNVQEAAINVRFQIKAH